MISELKSSQWYKQRLTVLTLRVTRGWVLHLNNKAVVRKEFINRNGHMSTVRRGSHYLTEHTHSHALTCLRGRLGYTNKAKRSTGVNTQRGSGRHYSIISFKWQIIVCCDLTPQIFNQELLRLYKTVIVSCYIFCAKPSNKFKA